MSRVLTIALNTFKETIRDRILGVIVLFALAMIVGSVWLGAISLGQAGRMMEDFGLVAVTLFGLVVAVFVGASLVRKEIDKRTVFVLFSKPLGRSEFIVGKFLDQLPRRHEVAKGDVRISAVVVDVDNPSGKALAITRLCEPVEL